jgi:hypothetical protein
VHHYDIAIIQREAVMGRHAHRMSPMEYADLARFDRIDTSFELPADEEFVCTNEEVRAACAVLRGIEGLGGIHDGPPD